MHCAEAIVALLVLAVAQVFGDDAALIQERELRRLKGYAVLLLINAAFVLVPLKARLGRYDMGILP
jgi:hypothetical protein